MYDNKVQGAWENMKKLMEQDIVDSARLELRDPETVIQLNEMTVEQIKKRANEQKASIELLDVLILKMLEMADDIKTIKCNLR